MVTERIHNCETNEITEVQIDDAIWAEMSTKPLEARIGAVRVERNNLLSQSDWTQTADSPLTPEKKTEWATYRQQLRDLPSTLTTQEDINNLVYPSQPTE